MVKLIVRYRTQKWNGDKYIYPEHSSIMTFEKIEEVTNAAIETIHHGWVEILDIKQILV